jgi:tetratricopeptide (TPR) repeat protein
VGDQTDQRLEDLFQTLRSSQDSTVLLEAESSIWKIWYESGQADIDSLLVEAAELMSSGQLADAESIYSRVIAVAPNFSEGWNRRATVRYYQRDYTGSLDDIEQTLKLEPRHFGAIWGLGMILGSQRDYQRAILAFERLLEIKPHASDARPRIELLKQELTKESV